jgi:hypothetical protein
VKRQLGKKSCAIQKEGKTFQESENFQGKKREKNHQRGEEGFSVAQQILFHSKNMFRDW